MQSEFFGYDGTNETVAVVQDYFVKAEWAYIGEGVSGDYNPSDPSDVRLLRFYVYRREGGEWVDVEDASYCTNMPLDAGEDVIMSSLKAVFSRFRDALDDPLASVKKLGEELSWISPEGF